MSGHIKTSNRNTSRKIKSKRRLLNNVRSDRHRDFEDLDFTVVTALTVDHSLDRSSIRMGKDIKKRGGNVMNLLNNNNNTRNENAASGINSKNSKASSHFPGKHSSKTKERMSKYACYTDPKGDCAPPTNKLDKSNSIGSTQKIINWMQKATKDIRVGWNMHSKGFNSKNMATLLNCFNGKSGNGDFSQKMDGAKDAYDEEDFTTVTTEYSKLNSFSKTCSSFSHNQKNMFKKLTGNRQMLETLAEQCTYLSKSIRSLRDEMNKAEGSVKKSGKYTKSSNASTSQSLESLTSLNKIIIDEDIWDMGKMNDSVKKIANDCVSSTTKSKSYSKKSKTPIEQGIVRKTFDSTPCGTSVEQKACVILFQKMAGDTSKSSDQDGSWNICGMEEVDANLVNVIKSISHNKSNSAGQSLKSNSKRNHSSRSSKSSHNYKESEESFSEVKTITVTTDTKTVKSRPKTEKSFPTKSKSKNKTHYSVISEPISQSVISEKSEWAPSWNQRNSRSISPSNRSYTSGASAGTFAEAPSPNFHSSDVYNNEVIHLIDYSAYNTNRNNSSASNADDEISTELGKKMILKKRKNYFARLTAARRMRINSVKSYKNKFLMNCIKTDHSGSYPLVNLTEENNSQDSSSQCKITKSDKKESLLIDSNLYFTAESSIESEYYSPMMSCNSNNNSLDDIPPSNKKPDNKSFTLNSRKLLYEMCFEPSSQILDSNQSNDTKDNQLKSSFAVGQEKIFGLSKEKKALLNQLENEDEDSEDIDEHSEDYREHVNKVKEEKQRRVQEQHKQQEQLTRDAIMAQMAARNYQNNPTFNSSQICKTVFNTKMTSGRPMKKRDSAAVCKPQLSPPNECTSPAFDSRLLDEFRENKLFNESAAEQMRLHNTCNSNQHEESDTFHLPPSYKIFIENKQKELKEKEDKAAAEKAAAALVQEKLLRTSPPRNNTMKIGQERPQMAASLVDTARIINYMHEINSKLDQIGWVVEDLSKKMMRIEQNPGSAKYSDSSNYTHPPSDFRVYETSRPQSNRYWQNPINDPHAHRDPPIREPTNYLPPQMAHDPRQFHDQQTTPNFHQMQQQMMMQSKPIPEEVILRQKTITVPLTVGDNNYTLPPHRQAQSYQIEGHLPLERHSNTTNIYQRPPENGNLLKINDPHVNQACFAPHLPPNSHIPFSHIPNSHIPSNESNVRNHGRSLTKTIPEMSVDRNLPFQKPVAPSNSIAMQRQQAMINLEQRRLLALHQQQGQGNSVQQQQNINYCPGDRSISELSHGGDMRP